jgi:predicted transposase YdaD
MRHSAPSGKIAHQSTDAHRPLAADRLLDLIETILDKFGSLTTKELEAMFGLSELKKTRVYQEGVEEGHQEAIENVLKIRFSKLDRQFKAAIPGLMQLPRQEGLQLAMQASREAIIDRFSPKS